MDKIDPKLIIDFRILNETDSIQNQEIARPEHLDMLVRVNDPEWNINNVKQIPGYEEVSRFGRSIGCVGTIETINFFQEDPAIAFVEASRPLFQENDKSN